MSMKTLILTAILLIPCVIAALGFLFMLLFPLISEQPWAMELALMWRQFP